MTDPDTRVIIALLLATVGGFIFGALFGSWRTERLHKDDFAKGQAHAARIYSRPPVDRVPTLKEGK